MKASEVTPCAVCGSHPLQAHGQRWMSLHRVTLERFFLDQKAAGSTVGMAMHFGQGRVDAPGAALLAEMFSGDPEVLKTSPEFTDRVLVCERCAAETPLLVIVDCALRARAEREAVAG